MLHNSFPKFVNKLYYVLKYVVDTHALYSYTNKKKKRSQLLKHLLQGC